MQHHPAVSRFGISPIHASDVRNNLTFEENLESKPRILANTLSKNRNDAKTNETVNLLKSDDRFTRLDGVVEI